MRQIEGEGVNENSFDAMRRAMILGQLRTTGVNDPLVLDAIAAVPRERFVEPAARVMAYADLAPAIGAGRALLPPMVLGRLLVEAAPVAGERALVAGAGTGYAAAVLAAMGLAVVAVEDDPALAARARELAGPGVKVVEGDPARGYRAGAPYDLLLIDGAVDDVPDVLLKQMTSHGRAAVVLVNAQGIPQAGIGRRVAGAFSIDTYGDAPAAARLPRFERARTFTF